jgi:class 3 adenylate cyclase
MPAEGFEGKLVAILAADIAGSSRLIGLDVEGHVARFRSLRREIIEPTIEKHRGRIFKSTGDGFLAEFPSVVDAVRCAVAMQTASTAREAAIPQERQIAFRIGINLGEVIVEDNDFFGDDVNIAARLQELAAPGGICISGIVRDQVHRRLDYLLADLGEQNLRNITQPVRAYRVSLPQRASRRPPRSSTRTASGFSRPEVTPAAPDDPHIDSPSPATAPTWLRFFAVPILGSFAFFYLIAAPMHFYFEIGKDGVSNHHSFWDACLAPMTSGVLYIVAFTILVEVSVRLNSYHEPTKVTPIAKGVLQWIMTVLLVSLLGFGLTLYILGQNTIDKNIDLVIIPQLFVALASVPLAFVIHSSILEYERVRG